MSYNERIKGVQVHRPIIYGSHARLLSEEEKATAPPGHTHKWTIFLASATSPPPAPRSASSLDPPPVDMDYLPGGHDDLSYLIKKVTFRLHETYTNPSRVCDHPPFQVSETGWGEFTVNIRIQFVAESGEKPMALAHGIKLHHWGPPIEGPVSAPPAAIPAETPASITPAAEVEGGDVKLESASETPQQPPPVDGNLPDPTPAVTAETDTESAAPVPVVAAPPAPISTINKMPVHAWQYDELVFSDPTQSFLTLMNANPPTALLPKNRRARDQREEADITKKGKKSRPSVSRQGTGTATPAPVGEEGEKKEEQEGEKEVVVPVVIGIPGEPGSADVPLEFTLEMEKGEWGRLNDVRINIVDEMDKWRERLIASEKELAKLKEEMRI
ncbi:YEATS domain-containing protein 4, partial [Tremellales sp. Uapishka_1]